MNIRKNKTFKQYKSTSSRRLTKKQKGYIQYKTLEVIKTIDKDRYIKINRCTYNDRCNLKACFYCSEIKSTRNTIKMIRLLCNTKSTMEIKHLVLSIDNVKYEDIEKSLIDLNNTFKSFKTINLYKNNILGFTKKTEINYIIENKKYRPHLHIVLFLKKNQNKHGTGITNAELKEALKKRYKGKRKLYLRLKSVPEEKYIKNIAYYIPKNNYRLTKDVVFPLIKNLKYFTTSEERPKHLENIINLQLYALYNKHEFVVSKSLKEYTKY